MWATATVAAGTTYVVVSVTESGEASYHRSDYTESRCTRVPARRSLVDIHGFRPISAGETALVTRKEGIRAPTLIYVRNRRRDCVAEWSLDDGP